ncbi:hypothetical protein WISP_09395 [Willisornis vidua]|uniref:Uncharacterized protein n=1 Tax=Willisornis vidua TaxID=1566151 RepID=A0ABQ9DRS4_9PASS|nr:hypothetical protein WISP_09395 [Willisornis vidua]
MDHSQRIEAKTGNENIPSRTHDVPVPSTGDGIQTQQEDNAVSETGTQTTNQEVNAVPTTTSDVPVPSTGDGVQTQHEANVVSETQTQPETNTALVRSVETQTQATTPRITIAPIKKVWMKETTKSIESPLQLEREEEEEKEEEAEADEGAAAREEGATAREERVVTVEEGAATREGEVVTGDRAHLTGLGARPKESRGVSRERKETEQATRDRITLDDLCSEYICKFPEEEKRRSMRIHHPEEEPSLPLQTQPSLGGVSSSLHARPTFVGIDDWGRPLSQHLKDYSLSPQCEQARSLFPRLERGKSSLERKFTLEYSKLGAVLWCNGEHSGL